MQYRDLKTCLSFATKQNKARPILRSIVVRDGKASVTDLETYVVINSSMGLAEGVHSLESAGLVPPTQNFEDFPTMPAIIGVISRVNVARLLLEKLLPYASKDEMRIYLNGVAVNNGALVATDGHTLAYEEGLNTFDRPFDAIMPAGPLKVLIGLLKRFKVNVFTASFSDEWFTISTLDFTFYGRLTKREYPKWRQIIPAKFNHELTIEASLWPSIKLYKSVINKRSRIVKLEVDAEGNMRLNLSSLENEVPTIYVGKCLQASITLGFNADYLDRLMKTIVGDLKLKFNNELSPFMYDSGPIKCVIMPCKI